MAALVADSIIIQVVWACVGWPKKYDQNQQPPRAGKGRMSLGDDRRACAAAILRLGDGGSGGLPKEEPMPPLPRGALMCAFRVFLAVAAVQAAAAAGDSGAPPPPREEAEWWGSARAWAVARACVAATTVAWMILERHPTYDADSAWPRGPSAFPRPWHGTARTTRSRWTVGARPCPRVAVGRRRYYHHQHWHHAVKRATPRHHPCDRSSSPNH